MAHIINIIPNGLQIVSGDLHNASSGYDHLVNLYRAADGYSAEWGINHAWDDHPAVFADLEAAIRYAVDNVIPA